MSKDTNSRKGQGRLGDGIPQKLKHFCTYTILTLRQDRNIKA